ncbi:hypothetical protein BAUCODRAFT_446765 [Baudoinia panamericana UAMH 10762]|uniref:Uncharacterized protein n=1 Tax=Baudoinia panamericana (strain UAMH 10762) TaxID=717646 RepID=M2NEF3_BAUPA|nr:uncharacterized protein BAUCODRAFT_446765 [Baudoinia panamericana UAMH 10762]EMC97340.1 hypothetical protein BAUCODRAFT_446765 [Baudoinia panamericana UAMH 10762]
MAAAALNSHLHRVRQGSCPFADEVGQRARRTVVIGAQLQNRPQLGEGTKLVCVSGPARLVLDMACTMRHLHLHTIRGRRVARQAESLEKPPQRLHMADLPEYRTHEVLTRQPAQVQQSCFYRFRSYLLLCAP